MWLLLVISGVICHSYDLEKALSKNYWCRSQIQRMNFSPCTLLLFVVLGKLFRTLTLDFLIYKMKTIPCCCFETQSHCIAQIHLALTVILLPQSSAQVAGVSDHSWFILIKFTSWQNMQNSEFHYDVFMLMCYDALF